MSQATFSIRMEAHLKRQFDNLCAEFGMNATTAFNVFARAVVRERRIPFEIASPEISLESGRSVFMALREESRKGGTQDLSLGEINAEIAHTRLGLEDEE